MCHFSKRGQWNQKRIIEITLFESKDTLLPILPILWALRASHTVGARHMWPKIILSTFVSIRALQCNSWSHSRIPYIFIKPVNSQIPSIKSAEQLTEQMKNSRNTKVFTLCPSVKIISTSGQLRMCGKSYGCMQDTCVVNTEVTCAG